MGAFGPRTPVAKAKSGLEKLVGELSQKIDFLGERLTETREELHGKIDTNAVSTQNAIERQAKQTDDRFERMFGAFKDQMAVIAITNGQAPPPSTPSPGVPVKALPDDSGEIGQGMQYGPAASGRRTAKVGPYAEDKTESQESK